jgi:thiamine pyrophosphate-dependent acetolactate synthase large subunit-like protein
MARAMGMDAEPVDTVASFEDAFGRACQADGPWLLDIDLAQFTPMEIRPQRPPRRN